MAVFVFSSGYIDVMKICGFHVFWRKSIRLPGAYASSTKKNYNK
jgi:hypothetical protein